MPVVEAVKEYRRYVLSTPELLGALYELAGLVLVCHCRRGQVCHREVLVELFKIYV